VFTISISDYFTSLTAIDKRACFLTLYAVRVATRGVRFIIGQSLSFRTFHRLYGLFSLAFTRLNFHIAHSIEPSTHTLFTLSPTSSCLPRFSETGRCGADSSNQPAYDVITASYRLQRSCPSVLAY